MAKRHDFTLRKVTIMAHAGTPEARENIRNSLRMALAECTEARRTNIHKPKVIFDTSLPTMLTEKSSVYAVSLDIEGKGSIEQIKACAQRVSDALSAPVSFVHGGCRIRVQQNNQTEDYPEPPTERPVLPYGIMQIFKLA